MSVQLLDKTRKINKLLHNNNSSKVVFNDICEVLTEILDSNTLVVSKKGKVLGGSKCEDVPYIEELIEKEVGKHIDDMLNERLLSILSTKENVNLETLGFSEEASRGYQICIRDRPSTVPPGPTAITSACCGFSFDCPGITIPDFVVSSAATCFKTTLSPNGTNFISIPP